MQKYYGWAASSYQGLGTRATKSAQKERKIKRYVYGCRAKPSCAASLQLAHPPRADADKAVEVQEARQVLRGELCGGTTTTWQHRDGSARSLRLRFRFRLLSLLHSLLLLGCTLRRLSAGCLWAPCTQAASVPGRAAIRHFDAEVEAEHSRTGRLGGALHLLDLLLCSLLSSSGLRGGFLLLSSYQASQLRYQALRVSLQLSHGVHKRHSVISAQVAGDPTHGGRGSVVHPYSYTARARGVTREKRRHAAQQRQCLPLQAPVHAWEYHHHVSRLFRSHFRGKAVRVGRWECVVVCKGLPHQRVQHVRRQTKPIVALCFTGPPHAAGRADARLLGLRKG
mmetsp:Transcript_99918/g.138838  ORF Transcript_99918/g.138838 Transcript_99918/m.138838 type:complete len:338 (-) Transcript_99918:193-1206(-)